MNSLASSTMHFLHFAHGRKQSRKRCHLLFLLLSLYNVVILFYISYIPIPNKHNHTKHIELLYFNKNEGTRKLFTTSVDFLSWLEKYWVVFVPTYWHLTFPKGFQCTCVGELFSCNFRWSNKESESWAMPRGLNQPSVICEFTRKTHVWGVFVKNVINLVIHIFEWTQHLYNKSR